MLNILIFNSQNSVVGNPNSVYLIYICLISKIHLLNLCWFLYFSPWCKALRIPRWTLWDSTLLRCQPSLAVSLPGEGCGPGTAPVPAQCSLFQPVQSHFLLLEKCRLQVKGKGKEISYFPAAVDSSWALLHLKMQLCPQTLGKAASRIVSVLFLLGKNPSVLSTY